MFTECGVTWLNCLLDAYSEYIAILTGEAVTPGDKQVLLTNENNFV
jgi:hypothetical protein